MIKEIKQNVYLQEYSDLQINYHHYKLSQMYNTTYENISCAEK